MLPDFKTQYKALAMEAAWQWLKDRHIYRLMKLKGVQKKTIYMSIDFQQGFKKKKLPKKVIQWVKDSLFKKCCWNNWIIIIIEEHLNPYFLPFNKIHSKWITDLNLRTKL